MHFLFLPSAVIRIPFQDNNMPNGNFYPAVGSEIALRPVRTLSSKEKLRKVITTFLIRMQREGCKNTQ